MRTTLLSKFAVRYTYILVVSLSILDVFAIPDDLGFQGPDEAQTFISTPAPHRTQIMINQDIPGLDKWQPEL